MRASRPSFRPRSHAQRRRRAQAGFTLMEVLVALAVFAISVVGLVALEARSIEAQRASREIRQAERLAQESMAELSSRGFVQLLQQDLVGAPNPAFPYDDQLVDTAQRVRDMNRPPADVPLTDNVVGSVRNSFIVYRRVDWVVNPLNAPSSNPPNTDLDDATNDIGLINALELEVLVMWIDQTNPAYPPPEDLLVVDLLPEMVDPDDPNFRPYVGHVQLRTVRVNNALSEDALGDSGGVP